MLYYKKYRLFIGIFSVLVIGGFFCTYYAKDTENTNPKNSTMEQHPLPAKEIISHLPSDGGKEYNRLVFEQSPYLLQHARNPVDWYPWGKAAFKKARKENKPVFLSIGYSTCHWCHVMERESFEDQDVAKLLNANYIAIKVDREERPDIDDVYMTVTQTLTGSGGWPMTIIMTPDKKPFFAGTYFPKHGKYRRPGMMELLPYMAKFWREEQEKVIEQADSIIKMLSDNEKKPPSEASLDEEIFAKAYSSFVNRFDEGHGGFGSSPKFPVPHNLTLLLRYWKRYDDPKALEMVEKTLTEMRLGGIYDHIGLGFHRYSTDKKWLLPHFEKMLYDQALLAIAYLEAFQATKNPFYAQTTREIFQYVLRDMTSEEGGFYSAEDADSEGEEGKFYLWTPKEIRKILSPEDATFFIETYHIEKGGNFQDQSTGKKTGESIPHLTESPNHLAQKLGVTSKEFSQRWEKIRQTLFTTRERRIHPFKDDKILTDWNGLMIAALAKGYQVLDDPQYLQAARRAADFILTKVSRDGQLQKRYRQGSAGLPAHLEDYAFFLWGLLDLYEASLENNYLKEALRIHTMMVEKFWDDKNGGFYMTAHDGEVLLLRKKDSYDGAIPSGNSIAALSLVRLGKITANSQIEEKLELLWKALSAAVIRYPSGHSQLLVAWDFSLGPAFEIVLCGERKSASTNEVLDILYHHFIPRKVVIFREKGEKEMDKIAPYTKNMKPIDPQKTTVYACENFSCRLPTTDYESLRELLLPKAR